MPPLDSFDIPRALRWERTASGLIRALIATPLAEAELYLQGGHLARWTPRGAQPVLFLSSKSQFTPGQAIRGGVPVIFPWFGARAEGKPGPAHGFARTAVWTIDATGMREDGAVGITLSLAPDDASRALGFDAFHLTLRVSIGADLTMEVDTHNTGDRPLVYEEALHTYFAVGDVRNASVTGLEGTTFIDKTDAFTRKQLSGEPLRITQETDQVHLNTRTACVIDDPAWNRRIVVEKSGSDSTVVWNPWIEKTAAMSDMAPAEWQRMLCIETANAAENAVHLAPGASHRLRVRVGVSSSPA